jgi:hypothetical protein
MHPAPFRSERTQEIDMANARHDHDPTPTREPDASPPARPGSVIITVVDRPDDNVRPPVRVMNASVSLYQHRDYRRERESARTSTRAKATGAPDLSKYEPRAEDYKSTRTTGSDGVVRFDDLEWGFYSAYLNHHPQTSSPEHFEIFEGCIADIELELGLGFFIVPEVLTSDCKPSSCPPRVNDFVQLRAQGRGWDEKTRTGVKFVYPPGATSDPNDWRAALVRIAAPGPQTFRVTTAIPFAPTPGTPVDGPDALATREWDVDAQPAAAQVVMGNLGVALSRTGTSPTADLAFWQRLIASTEQLSFNTYLRFMNSIFCGDAVTTDDQAAFNRAGQRAATLQQFRMLPFTDADAYRLIKVATEAFVMVNCGVLADIVRDRGYLERRDLPAPAPPISEYLVQIPDGHGHLIPVLPYLALIRSKLPEVGIKLGSFQIPSNFVEDCHGILREKLVNPCMLELIWSYWHEEGMLVQTLNMIARRFQNVRSTSEPDPLANLDIDPLRPLSNLLWGYTLDEQHRLSVMRRNYEYDHHYGLRLEGRAVQNMRPADSRSRFLEAFHNLLRLCLVFYRQDDDTTVKADAFPVLNALKEVHLILSQGAHNQFGDLPSTARIEMLMQQWLLARPELREFLPTRLMVAYPEPWMDRVDAMKKMQGWSDTSVLHFRNLALFGEQLLLSIRWGHWSDVFEPVQAFNWARFFRPQVQGYTHAYRAVTGVDLNAEYVDAQIESTLPSVLLQRRLAQQQRAARPA